MTSVAVSVAGLTKRFGARTAVDDIELPAGVVAGFVGPNGAGKTTTMAMLLGLVSPTAGTGTVLGASMKTEGKEDDLTHRVLNGMLDAYVRTLEEACDVDRMALGNYVQATLHGSAPL